MTSSATSLRLSVTEPTEPEPATFHLVGQELVVGRDESAELVVAEASVSGRHGRFAPTSLGYTYTDLGSTNGSALARGAGPPVACVAGETLPLQAGDVLLLGDRDRAVVIRVEAAELARAPSSSRTVIAHAPLVDLLARPRRGLGELASLAARVMTISSAEALAAQALEFVAGLAPHAALRGVALWGLGLAAKAGEPIPRGLVETAMADAGLAQAEILSEGSAVPLPQTASIATQRARPRRFH